MTLPVSAIVFYIVSAALVSSALMVVCMKNPVRSILSLVFCFVLTAILWLLLQAEFLALVLIFVYVGAVMTLFLFVVMMMKIDKQMASEKFVRYLPLAILLLLAFVAAVMTVLHQSPSLAKYASLPTFPAGHSNTAAMGSLLYTKYVYPFQITAVILLVAMIAAIGLVFKGRRPGTQSQRVKDQLQASKENRLHIVDMGGKKK